MLKKQQIIMAVSISVLAVYWLLPLPTPISFGLCLLLWVAIMWMGELWPLPITALMVPILAVASQTLSMPQALSSFAQPIIFLNLGGFALAAALHLHGVDRRLAAWLTHLAGDNTFASFMLLFIATAILSMWISNMATTVMMLPIALQLVPEKYSKARIFALLGIAYSANIGGMGTIIGSPPNALTAAALGLSFADWMKIGIPAVFCFLPVMIFSLYKIITPEQGIVLEKMQDHREPWAQPAKKAIVIFAVTIFCWVFSRPLAALMGISQDFDTLIAMSAVIAMVASGVITWKQLQHHVDWGVLVLFGGGLCLSAVLGATDTTAFLANTVFGSAGQWGWVFLLFVILLLVVFLTEFSSNLGTAAVLIPIVVVLAETMFPENTQAMVMAVGLACSCAFMLPVATPSNALVYGTGLIPQRLMLKAGLVLNILALPILFGILV